MGALRPLIPLVGINWLLPRRPTQQASAGEWREVLPPQDETPGSGLRKGPQACRNFFSSSPWARSPGSATSAFWPRPNLHRYWADYGCVVLQPYDMEVGAGTFHPATTLALAWAQPVEGRLRAALAPPQGRPLRRKPEPPAALLPVPGDPEAQPVRPAGALSRLALCHRHRSEGARHPLCRGRLGKPDAGRLGAWLGMLVRRHGSQRSSPTSSRSRHRVRTRGRRADLRSRASGDVCPGRRQRL
jgi:hypothetical protein